MNCDTQETEEKRAISPRLADWMWRPWYAKLYLALTLLYWVGLEGMLIVPFERLNGYLVNVMVVLIFIFNPITVVGILGYGFLMAKVACGDWMIVPGAPRPKPLMDPTADPFDVRSGDLHLRHIGVIKD